MTNNILLQVDFPFDGPWGPVFTAAMAELARDIASEQGLVWKIWTESVGDRRAGGVYLFSDETLALRFREKHIERLDAFGIGEISASARHVNVPLSRMTRATI